MVHSATNDPDCGLKVLSEYEYRSYNFIAIHEVISFACGKARLFGLDHGIAESTTLQIRGHFILFLHLLASQSVNDELALQIIDFLVI